ncbi:MAG: hypothetical protein V7603_5107 [Micromonosporaceae bacterium]
MFCCPHPARDRLTYCTGCGADLLTVEPPAQWALVLTPASGWELRLGEHLAAVTDDIPADSRTEAFAWAAAGAGAAGDDVVAFTARPARHGDAEYVAVLAVSGPAV